MSCRTCTHKGFEYVFHTQPHEAYDQAKTQCESRGKLAVLDEETVKTLMKMCCQNGDFWVDFKGEGKPRNGAINCNFIRLSEGGKHKGICNNGKGYICQVALATTEAQTKQKVSTTIIPIGRSSLVPKQSKQQPLPRIDNSTLNVLGSSNTQHKIDVGVVAGALLGALFVLMALIGFFSYRNRRQKKAKWDFEILVKQRSTCDSVEQIPNNAIQSDHGYYTVERSDTPKPSDSFANEEKVNVIPTAVETSAVQNCAYDDYDNNTTATNQKQHSNALQIVPITKEAKGGSIDHVYATVQKTSPAMGCNRSNAIPKPARRNNVANCNDQQKNKLDHPVAITQNNDYEAMEKQTNERPKPPPRTKFQHVL